MSNFINSKSLFFPRRLQCTDIRSLSLVIGFEEKNVQGGFTSDRFICSICHRLPRFPCRPNGCTHIYCEYCLEVHFTRTKKTLNWVDEANCPACENTFYENGVGLFYQFDMATQALFNEIKVQCPNDCGYVASARVIDAHQIYECPKRTINCPNRACGYRASAKEIEEDHFAKCSKLRVYCYLCNLPLPVAVLFIHNCKRRQKAAAKSMILPFADSELSYYATITVHNKLNLTNRV